MTAEALRRPPARAVAGALAVAALAVELHLRAGGPYTVRLVDDLAQLLSAALAALACLRAALRRRGRERLAFAALGAAAGSWAAGQAVWSWYELVARVVSPFPSPADVGYLGFPAGATVALLAYPSGRSTLRSRRLLPDAATVGLSLLLLSWATALGAVYDEHVDGALAFAVSLTYPVADVVLVGVAVLVVTEHRRHGRAWSRPLALMGAGLTAMAVSDSAFVYLTATSDYDGSVADTGWVVAFLLLVAAAARPGVAAGSRTVPPAAPRGIGRTEVVLPYVPFAVAGGAVVAGAVTGHRRDAVELVLSAVLVALVLLRQVLVILENQALVAALRQREGELHHQTLHDRLTGLPNRALLGEHLERALAGPGRPDGATRPAPAVLVAGLDDLKSINDTFGHGVGDELLTATARRLAGAAPTGSTVARLGGDEFAVLLEQGAAGGAGERLLQAFDEPFTLREHRIRARASLGLVLPPHAVHDSAADLLRKADLAMYAAKARGKGCLVVFDEALHQHDDAALRSDLADSVATGGIELHYQLMHALTPAGPPRPVGAEVLARWAHPAHGPVSPAVFVPIAERSGIITELGRLVLTKAVAQAARWHRAAPGDAFFVSVNLSPVQLHDPDLVGTVRWLLESHELPPDRLLVEVTETALLTHDGPAGRTLDELAALGVAVAVDDFGTGFSSIAHLRSLPVDVLKIDRSLVEGLLVDRRDATLCRALIDLAHQLGLRVVAEGVEEPAQLDALVELGCDLVQGYLLDRPRPAPADPRAPALPRQRPAQEAPQAPAPAPG